MSEISPERNAAGVALFDVLRRRADVDGWTVQISTDLITAILDELEKEIGRLDGGRILAARLERCQAALAAIWQEADKGAGVVRHGVPRAFLERIKQLADLEK